MIISCFVFMFGLIYGSFLNMLAWRLTFQKALAVPRSYCTHCEHTLLWYDMIPVISWAALGGSCRFCKQSISLLYPCIELLTALVLVLLWHAVYIPAGTFSFIAYLIPISALVVSIRSDLEACLISQLCTLWCIPIGCLMSLFGLLNITIYQSLLGVIIGYVVLSLVALIFKIATGKDGLGEGDAELLAMIGSFWGVEGVWSSLTIGSIAGACVGGLYLLMSGKSKDTPIPFGPFLIFGLFCYFFV